MMTIPSKIVKLSDEQPSVYPCIPVDFLWMPLIVRKILGITTILFFVWAFLTIPAAVLYTFILLKYRQITVFTTLFYGSLLMSMIIPMREWPIARKVGQLWYELFDFSCNLNPKLLSQFVNESSNQQFVVSMHPHGVIPLQAILWAAYCDQYLHDLSTGKQMYGFGAVADVMMYLPYLRNIMGWLSAGSATYSVLMDGLSKGIVPCVNAAGRKPTNLYILPGGIAEIYTSTPGKHSVIFKSRRGLVKLCLETGAAIIPTYVFGGTDFFHNLATSDSLLSRMSRKFRISLTLFWGPFYLPIPYFPKVTMCMADPIMVEKWQREGPVPTHLIEELHIKYIASLKKLFDDYKALAGYPDAELEVL